MKKDFIKLAMILTVTIAGVLPWIGTDEEEHPDISSGSITELTEDML